MTRRRSGALFPVVLILLLALLAGIFFVGDWLVRRAAEQAVAEQVKAQLSLAVAPTVQIKDFPVLSGFSTKQFNEIRLSSGANTVGSGVTAIELTSVAATLNGVVWTDAGSITVARVGGTMETSWGFVTRAASRTVSYAGTDDQGVGRVAILVEINIVGRKLPLSVTGRPVLTPQGNVTLDQITFASGLEQLPEWLRPTPEQLQFDGIPIRMNLPDGLSITAVRAVEAGMVIELQGTDVQLT